MKHVLSAACCLALCVMPALGQKKAAGAAMTDQQFIDFAGQTDMVEANLGQMAASVATSDEVKNYGQTLASEHTQDFNELYKLAQQTNLKRPNDIDSEHNKMMIDPFQKLKGAAFDKKYVHEMIAGHTKAIAVYKKEATDAENAAVKSYAEQTLPTLQKHLDNAKALEKTPAKAE